VFVYWLGALIDGSFDVYIGGPVGGIWFWSVIGLGIACVRLSATHPDTDPVATDDRVTASTTMPPSAARDPRRASRLPGRRPPQDPARRATIGATASTSDPRFQ
jgi:hypothetical protein